ncbi:MAG: ATP synthase subunit I [Gammaproteobacteria bacterium]|nr:ATP synthase subunit I [Gammaproteobacteria bacterium]
MSNLKPPPVYKIIVMQLVATGLIAVVLLLFLNATAAFSILIGGLISAIPNCYFTIQAFKFNGARNAEKVVKSFLKGEIGKIVITIVLFALAFTQITNVNEIALMAGFIAVQFIGIIMSAVISSSPSGNRA